jgi:uncharacterized membrane protein YedE/YeeE
MQAVASGLFFQPLGADRLFGALLYGTVVPLDTALAAGAFLFGIGMQQGGCSSGPLLTVGGGSMRMVLTLIFCSSCLLLSKLLALERGCPRTCRSACSRLSYRSHDISS